MTTVPVYRVHVVDQATVVERGEQVTTWIVQLGDGWVRAADHPEGEVSLSSAESGDGTPPGTIWRREVELRLPAGALLRCRVTEPSATRLDPIEYLRRGTLSVGRAKRESVFRVLGNYRLERVQKK